jgi:hypothetical protein
MSGVEGLLKPLYLPRSEDRLNFMYGNAADMTTHVVSPLVLGIGDKKLDALVLLRPTLARS